MNPLDEIKLTLHPTYSEFAKSLQLMQERMTRAILHQTLSGLGTDLSRRDALDVQYLTATCLDLACVEYGL